MIHGLSWENRLARETTDIHEEESYSRLVFRYYHWWQ